MNVIPNGAVARAAHRFNRRVRGTDSYFSDGHGVGLSEFSACHLRVGTDDKHLVIQHMDKGPYSFLTAEAAQRFMDRNPIVTLVIAKLIVEYENSELRQLIDNTRRAYGIDTRGQAIRNRGELSRRDKSG